MERFDLTELGVQEISSAEILCIDGGWWDKVGKAIWDAITSGLILEALEAVVDGYAYCVEAYFDAAGKGMYDYGPTIKR